MSGRLPLPLISVDGVWWVSRAVKDCLFHVCYDTTYLQRSVIQQKVGSSLTEPRETTGISLVCEVRWYPNHVAFRV